MMELSRSLASLYVSHQTGQVLRTKDGLILLALKVAVGKKRSLYLNTQTLLLSGRLYTCIYTRLEPSLSVVVK